MYIYIYVSIRQDGTISLGEDSHATVKNEFGQRVTAGFVRCKVEGPVVDFSNVWTGPLQVVAGYF